MSFQSNLPSSNKSILFFILLTVIYFVIQYKTKEDSNIWSIIYIITLLITQFGLNINLTKAFCGELQIQTAFIYTIFPWTLIFGLLNVILLIFPGWLRPFSNTFGYIVVKALGNQNILNSILINKNTSNAKVKSALEQIYDNPFLLINEIPPTNEGFKKFIDELNGIGNSGTESLKLIRDNVTTDDTELLHQMVRLKFIVSKFIWFLLTGCLTITTSYNYIVQSKCSTSVALMEARHTEYEKEINNENNKEIDSRIYNDYGE